MLFAKPVYASRTFQEDPLQSFKFRLSINGLPPSLGFTKVSGISREVEVVTYLENMFDYEHKLPGRETVGEITLEKGVYAGDENLWNIYCQLFKKSTAVRRDATLYLCDRWGDIRRTFELAECWFSKIEFGDFDASNSEVLIETATFQFEHFLN